MHQNRSLLKHILVIAKASAISERITQTGHCAYLENTLWMKADHLKDFWMPFLIIFLGWIGCFNSSESSPALGNVGLNRRWNLWFTHWISISLQRYPGKPPLWSIRQLNSSYMFTLSCSWYVLKCSLHIVEFDVS